MTKTIQIRDVDDDLYDQLVKRAAEVGVTVPELLRQEIVRLVSRPSMAEWLDRTRRRSSNITREQILADLDEIRGPWPDAGR
jgi:antitoxin FitA